MDSNPHDRFARRAFADLDVMRAHLRGFLPPGIASRLDLTGLRREPDVHLDPALRERLSDLLFSTPTVAGPPALVWFVFEHRSTPDRWLPYDLSRSAHRILEEWRRTHPDGEHLPMVIPLVLYAGTRPFTAPRRLLELCSPDPSLRESAAGATLDLGYTLTDLSRIGDDVIRDRVGDAAFAALAHLLLKHARAEDLPQRLGRWSALLRGVLRAPTGLDALRTLLTYVLAVRGTDTERELTTVVLPCLDARDQETVMSTFKSYADVLREEGIEEGRRRDAADKLLRILRSRFEVSDATVARVGAAPLEELDRWFDRALLVGAIEEVFAD